MKRSILTLAVLVLPFLAIAKGKKYNNISLDSLSEEFLYNINDNFLVVDAYSDGLIQEGKPYDIAVYKTNVSVNGKALPAKLGKKYATKLNEYWNKYEVPTDFRKINIHSDRLSMYVVCKNYVRRNYSSSWNEPIGKTDTIVLADLKDRYFQHVKLENELSQNLCNDNIVRMPMDVHLRFNTEGVWVNGKEINKRFTNKYIALISEVVNRKPKDVNDFIGYKIASRDIRAQLNKKS